MVWDTTISIEGLATAIGVLGAAMGYVVNLIKGWRDEAQNQKRRGTYSAILHTLEDDLIHGLNEIQLWERYCSEDLAAIRRRYGALAPAKLDPVKFEALIRDLRLDRLIETVGKDQYRLETRRLTKYDLEEEADVGSSGSSQLPISTDAIADRVREVALDKALSTWRRRGAFALLARVAPEEGVERLTALLASQDHEEVVMAGELLADLAKK